jgi:hypothetical protein
MSLNDEMGAEPATARGAVLTVSQLHEGVRSAWEEAGLTRVWVSGLVTGLRRGPRSPPGSWWSTARMPLGSGPCSRWVGSPGSWPRSRPCATAPASSWPTVSKSPCGAGWTPTLGSGGCGCSPRASTPASVGAAVLARDAVVAELATSGDLDAQQPLALPPVVRRIGLVSSAAAAGRADVPACWSARHCPSRWSRPRRPWGHQAPGEVAAALGILAGAGVDVVVVARGGGARSDLAPWDSGELARAIARCPVPVWMALGHSRDQPTGRRIDPTRPPRRRRPPWWRPAPRWSTRRRKPRPAVITTCS